jgi:hypothetical protein
MSELINGWWSTPYAYLSAEHRQVNANTFYKFFAGNGWTKKSIAAMLGNIEVESTINPGLWQGGYPPVPPSTIYTTNKGFGLTQWTPANKLITWADSNSLDYTQGNTQVQCIQYEMENGLQWGNDVNISFYDFAHDNSQTLERLVLAWLWDYERPADPNIPLRQELALKWLSAVHPVPIWLLYKMGQRRL